MPTMLNCTIMPVELLQYIYLWCSLSCPVQLVPVSFRNIDILCTYLPTATGDMAQNQSKMSECIKLAMKHIAQHNQSSAHRKIRSLALPLIGTGRYGYDQGSAAIWITDALCEALKGNTTGLETVILVDKKPTCLGAWQTSLKGIGTTFEERCVLPVITEKHPGW